MTVTGSVAVLCVAMGDMVDESVEPAGETAWMSIDEWLDLLDMAEMFDDRCGRC